MAASRLKKQLGLFDVYAISTGAMFSSGFFLLPGIAAASTGPSVALAYGVASIFIIPAMLSVAELATAMPKAGGAYYFLDRSMGPMVGTIGGLGTWIALVLKSAFALVGMGAYLAIFINVPIEPLAIGLTILFMVVNVIGAKETSGLQRWLVGILLVILGFFVVQGLFEVMGRDAAETRAQFTPFMPFGAVGFFSTIGLVFVSYAGLTKVASVAEEVHQPERNIPLGMFLSLATATFIYVVGVAIIVAVLEPSELRSDLTPVATAAAAFFDWLPNPVGLVLIVIAAIAAFASTGNAGILSASRYPLAMARDRLIWGRFAKVGRFGTPTLAIVVTAGAMAASILLLDIEGIAKLASAFQLLLFAMLNLAVIIMRESRIEAYLPRFQSPAYPWVQIFGMIGPLWLITEMGELAVLFTLALVAACIGWYFYYARGRVVREGAIYHTFARLGRLRYEGLDLELRTLVKEQGLRREDPFDEIVARAPTIDAEPGMDFRAICELASSRLAERTGLGELEILAGFIAELEAGVVPVAREAAMPHLRAPGVEQPEMVLVRSKAGVDVVARMSDPGVLPDAVTEAATGSPRVHAIFFILSPEDKPGHHLRLLGHLATHVDDDTFLPSWLAAPDAHALRESLLREERSISFRLQGDGPTSGLIGQRILDLRLPSGTLIVLIRRGTETVVPHGMTVLNEGDRLTIVGDTHGIRALAGRYGGGAAGRSD